ncbi:nuclear pore complex protein Nup85-like [Anneissia japonica]|uniref:nuclear pore complex protein Nup85-like n=1 Tax=Anneissia japonica TaxID=1529436 RepID=UPI0014255F7F|nr:nuclear pore complex protein Nup85-like [Anneissia japonica]
MYLLSKNKMAAYDPEREAPVFCIPDEDAATHGLSACWGLGHQLLLHAGVGKKCFIEKEEHGTYSSQLNAPSMIHFFKWEVDMQNPETRKLVSESYNIFQSLQTYEPESVDTAKKSHLVKFSRKYRSIIAACVQNLRKASQDPKHGEAVCEEYSIQCEVFQMIGLLWSLCEIMFVETLPGGTLQQLLDWVKWHFDQGDRLAKEILRLPNPTQSPEYWNAIYIYVLQGRIAEARNLLTLHPSQQRDVHGVFARINELLRKMPVYGAFTRQSLAEFDMKWRHWQDQCIHCLEDQELSSHAELETICRILAGDDNVFIELRDLTETWYQMLVAKLLYTNPTVKTFDLQYHTKSCIDAYGGTIGLAPFDNILLAALEFDIHQVIKESSTCLNNWWFSAHITDLLHHCGQLETHQLNYGSNLREFLLLEYVSSLMSHESMWQICMGYLDHCTEFGRHYQELLVERVPLQTDKKAIKLLEMCKERDMKDQVKTICKVMCRRAMHNGRLGSALSWCMQSKDAAFATYLSEKFLAEYTRSGDFSNLDLIDNLGPGMLLSDRLTFVGKYREFHRLYEQGDFKEGASLLLSLLSAKLAPKRFWLTLLTDALPLLELQDVILSSKQTYELMHSLQDCRDYHSQQYSDRDYRLHHKGAFHVENEKIELLQLALARNLARAILEEASSG